MKRIYAYTTPERYRYLWERDGLTRKGIIKIGETNGDSWQRIRQQLITSHPEVKKSWMLLDVNAEKNNGECISDHDIHKALINAGVNRVGGEWFEATITEVKAAIIAIKNGTPLNLSRSQDFSMRPEQKQAVELTSEYFIKKNQDETVSKYLWNAKMRFGKTFTAYQLARKMKWKRVLVLTYKPAVLDAWRDDLNNHTDFSDWHFVDRNMSKDEADRIADETNPLVWFASFQDIMGSDKDGSIKKHNETLHLIDWDCIIVDEYHFGAWRDNAKDFYDSDPTAIGENEMLQDEEDPVTESDIGLSSKHYLYLSGTPFRAITEGEFNDSNIFNWTYIDEQSAKNNWNASKGVNPYIDLPSIEMFAYDIGSQVIAVADEGEFNGFSLNEYFKASKNKNRTISKKTPKPGDYVFVDPTRVQNFLDLLLGKIGSTMRETLLAKNKRAPFPYESPDFTEAVKHSVWYLPDVASCYAMRDMLHKHPFFNKYSVVVAAGVCGGSGAEAKKPVQKAINQYKREGYDGTITLSCGKLMTGVTVKQWSSIFMLRSLTSPETYFQAIFRVQSPYSKYLGDGSIKVYKPKAYIFEFDPNRALSLISEYGMKLSSDGEASPKKVIQDLMNFLPIYSYQDGQMRSLDSNEVLNIATTGIGATALAAKWNSSTLVKINETTLMNLLNNEELLSTLEKMADFRALRNDTKHIITSTEKLKETVREKGKNNLNEKEKKEKKENSDKRADIRRKLQKLLTRIPIFMYVTDHREEALKDVIETIDSELFETVTGLSVEDFQTLNKIGLFNPAQMNAAILQFRNYENSSLHYADDIDDDKIYEAKTVGLWDQSIEVVSNI